MKYRHRNIEEKLKKLAKDYPVLTIAGPRQSGKSTLVKNVFPNHDYVTLENLDIRADAKKDPRGFLKRFSDPVIIDEVQNVPDLMSYIQGIVDEEKIKARFILTGSSQLDLRSGVSQSLAGRASVSNLLPLTLGEYSADEQQISLEDALFHGGYPAVHFESSGVVDWYQDYCQNYIERDARRLINIKELGTFQTFLKMCAGRCGQVLNYTSLADDCGISPNTVKEWLNILDASFIAFTLRPYYKNYSKRLTKNPKLYFYDTGVVCSLLGITDAKELHTHPFKGGIFESWVISEIIKDFYNIHRIPPIYFWRNGNSLEIDLIIKVLEQVIAVEIKSGKTMHTSFLKNLLKFKELAGDDVCDTTLVYGGDDERYYSDTTALSFRDIGYYFLRYF